MSELMETLCGEALCRFGAKNQTHKAIEELAELAVELAHWAQGRGDGDRVAEEIADVQIMALQMALLVGVEKVEKAKGNKLERLRGRLESARDRLDRRDGLGARNGA